MNELVRRCLDRVHNGFLITDDKGKVLYFNKSYIQLTKLYDLKVNDHIIDYWHKGLIESEPACLAALKDGGTIIKQFYQRFNKVFIVSLSEPIYDMNGKIITIVTQVVDATELFTLRDDIENVREMMEKFPDEKSVNEFGDHIISFSKPFRQTLELCRQVAPYDVSILIRGESGVGKDLVAHFIHDQSNRRDKPFYAVNCSAIPENLLETELFGYEKGTFTGQTEKGKEGLLAAADGGTLFLDEIGDMPLALQAKILRVLETKSYRPVGSNKNYNADVRIISATNQDLEELIKKKSFREDLYYRINAIEVLIPPLRERVDDIIPLTMFFLKGVNSKYGFTKIISPVSLQQMVRYKWPGNVRQLKNVVESMVVTSTSDQVFPPSYISHYKRKVQSSLTEKDSISGPSVGAVMDLKSYIELQERNYLINAYKIAGTTRKMAELLEVNHSTVMRKLKKYDIRLSERKEKDS